MLLVPSPLQANFLAEGFSVTCVNRFLLGLSYKIAKPESLLWPELGSPLCRFKVKHKYKVIYASMGSGVIGHKI